MDEDKRKDFTSSAVSEASSSKWTSDSLAMDMLIEDGDENSRIKIDARAKKLEEELEIVKPLPSLQPALSSGCSFQDYRNSPNSPNFFIPSTASSPALPIGTMIASPRMFISQTGKWMEEEKTPIQISFDVKQPRTGKLSPDLWLKEMLIEAGEESQLKNPDDQSLISGKQIDAKRKKMEMSLELSDTFYPIITHRKQRKKTRFCDRAAVQLHGSSSAAATGKPPGLSEVRTKEELNKSRNKIPSEKITLTSPEALVCRTFRNSLSPCPTLACRTGGYSDAPLLLGSYISDDWSHSFIKNPPTHPQKVTCATGPGCSKRDSEFFPRSHSSPSLSLITSAENKTFKRVSSLPNLLLKTSCEQFTPDLTGDEHTETYRFQCSGPGLYQCSVTGLMFHMNWEGDVVYKKVPWNRKLLFQHRKQPAGPLFDITCEQQSVCQLYLPHCEIRSTGGTEFLSVAHVTDDGIELIGPHRLTETHVIINITGFSAFGVIKDEDSPPVPVRALVLLFYRPPVEPDIASVLNVLLLPKNVVLQDVLRKRKKIVGDECYIETPPYCKLHPQQEYMLSTCPEDDSVLVEPTEAEFDCDSYDNLFPSFQVNLERIFKHIKLCLKDTNGSKSVWERRVCLSSTGAKSSCWQSALNPPSIDRLLAIHSSFVVGVSGPVLKYLLDKLFEKQVLNDSERESVVEMSIKEDKARCVIDMVRRKGEAASSEMIKALCEVDPFLSEHLGLM